MRIIPLCITFITCIQAPQIKNSIVMQKEHTKTNIDCYELDYVQRILDKKIKGISQEQEQEQDTRWIATQAQEEYKITCKE